MEEKLSSLKRGLESELDAKIVDVKDSVQAMAETARRRSYPKKDPTWYGIEYNSITQYII